MEKYFNRKILFIIPVIFLFALLFRIFYSYTDTKRQMDEFAFKEAGKEEIMDILTGPNSFLFTFDNDEGSMKELAKAIKANESLRFKGGYIEGE